MHHFMTRSRRSFPSMTCAFLWHEARKRSGSQAGFFATSSLIFLMRVRCSSGTGELPSSIHGYTCL